MSQYVALKHTREIFPQVYIIHYMDDILLAYLHEPQLVQVFAHMQINLGDNRGVGHVCVFPQDTEGAHGLPEILVQQVKDVPENSDDDDDNVQEAVNSFDTVDICPGSPGSPSSNLGK